jgi:DNA-binding response OmpR family regulator
MRGLVRVRETTPKPRVLIVDDDEAVRNAVAEVLGEEGFDVRLAESGRRALSVLGQDEPPALVLLDLMMPDVNGWQVLETMRSTGRLSAIPVVVLTAFDAGVGLPPGCRVLHKPLERELLVAEARALT